MIVKIEGKDLPGAQCGRYGDVAVGVQRRAEVVEIHPADAAAVSWSFEVTTIPAADGSGLDVRGPFVHGRPGDRFLYLSWGEHPADGSFAMFRRAKLMLDAVPPERLPSPPSQAARWSPGSVSPTAEACRCAAAVRPPVVTWSASAIA